MYADWFLDYASYVILERAVPHLNDGLKPVQRRILHSLKEKDDGRYNKVANIVGHTMQYHPHGDASIGDAWCSLARRTCSSITQGNWGNVPHRRSRRRTTIHRGPPVQARQRDPVQSQDNRLGRPATMAATGKPVTLPVKFPLVLAQGVEGIAVGLACKILPHNFVELCDASIASLRKKEFEINPDFIQGGIADVSDYNDGLRGGKVRPSVLASRSPRNAC